MRRFSRLAHFSLEEGFKKKGEKYGLLPKGGKVWSFTKLPSDPPPGLVFFAGKKLTPIFFVENFIYAMAKTNFSQKKILT